MIVPLMTLKGVQIFPFGFISEARSRANSRTAWRAFRALPVSLLFLFMVSLLVPVFGEIAQADEDGRPENEDEGDSVQAPRGMLRIVRRCDLVPESEFLEGDGGEVHGPRAAAPAVPA